jgi:hypothetical protein
MPRWIGSGSKISQWIYPRIPGTAPTLAQRLAGNEAEAQHNLGNRGTTLQFQSMSTQQ